MRARKYNKKIKIFYTTKVSDGFGGFTIQDNFLKSIWCKIDTLGVNSRFNNANTDYGTLDTANSLRLLFRNRNDLLFNSRSMYFVYRNYKYVIQNTPINLGFDDSEIEIIVTRENGTIIGYIPGMTFDRTDYFFNLPNPVEKTFYFSDN